MALMRLNGFSDLFREMNRFQEELNRTFTRTGGSWPQVGPPVNMWADEHAVFVEADLPGIDPDKLDISVTEGNRLTIQGEKAHDFKKVQAIYAAAGAASNLVLP